LSDSDCGFDFNHDPGAFMQLPESQLPQNELSIIAEESHVPVS
jgi:hypothetical protein